MISKYETFKRSIINYIHTCGMDIGMVYFIMKDIFTEIENLYYGQINREALEQTKQNKNEKGEGKCKTI